MNSASWCLPHVSDEMISTCLCFHSKNGHPFMVCPHRMTRLHSSSAPSTLRTFTINASFSTEQQTTFIRKHPEVIAVVEKCNFLAGVFAQALAKFSKLESKRPHLADLSLSGGNSANTRLLGGEWKRALLVCMNMSLS